jgi:hypothetical protein
MGVLVVAWGVYGAGVWRVGHLSWVGYDADPDIAESLRNDARCARVILPFVCGAAAMDVTAFGVAIMGVLRERRWWWNLAAIVLCVGSVAWHVWVLVMAGFMAV